VSDGISPQPMEGHGAYNAHSQLQAATASPGVELLRRAAHTVAFQSSRPIVVADYGCAQGRNSLEPMAVAKRALRDRAAAGQAICFVHDDVPENDFATLFQTLASPESYLRDDPNAFACAIGRSFYEQIVPPESVTLGWTAWSLQWLSRTPMAIPDQVQVAYSRDAAARTAFERQAADDWNAFLQARAIELCDGGALVIVTMALDERGNFGYESVLTALYEGLMQLVADGLLTSAEAHRMVIPTVARSRQQLLAPFAQAGTFAGLHVEQCDVYQAPDPFFEAYERDGDAKAFGSHWAALCRTADFPSLASALREGTSDPREPEFFTRLEAEIATRMAAHPAPSVMPLARMLCVKRG